jgi:uroporphyrinogen-III synthase
MSVSEVGLSGRVVAVPETRELDLFAAMLERRGARVLRCPLVDIRDAPDPAPVLAWIRDFSAGGCDDLILMTGEGVRRLLGCVDQHAPELRAGFVAGLGRVRIIARGPKPARVLRELGIKPALLGETPTTAGLIATLKAHKLRGRRVGVQLYGTEPNRPLIDFLVQAGADVRSVAPYVYADHADAAAVLTLGELLAGGAIDAIAFTSMQQVLRLFAVAETGGALETLERGLARCCVAAVGPLVQQTLVERGVRVDLVPSEQFFLKPLTQRLAEKLGPKRELQSG